MKGLSSALAMALSAHAFDSGWTKMPTCTYAISASKHRANKSTKKARKAQKNARRMNRSSKR